MQLMRIQGPVISFTEQMHSSYYIYESESTNNYVSEVKNCPLRFKTRYLM